MSENLKEDIANNNPLGTIMEKIEDDDENNGIEFCIDDKIIEEYDALVDDENVDIENIFNYELDLNDEITLSNLRRCLMASSDINFSKMYGPSNPKIPEDGEIFLCESSPNGKCMMRLCTCFEDDEDWFVGYCTFCEKTIESEKDALRIPLGKGGFKGCLCSFDCMHECLNENPDAVEHILIEICRLIIYQLSDQDFLIDEKLHKVETINEEIDL